MKVMIAAAGTGGHVFPGLAVAEQLQQRQVSVCWLGTDTGKEVTWVMQAGISIHTIAMQGVRGRGWRSWLRLPWRLAKAIWQAWQIMRRERPDVLLVMGGYVCVPAAIAARLCAIAVCVHEQNALVGLSNQLLAYISQQCLLGLPLQRTPKAWRQARLIGNPLRQSMVRQPKWRADHPLRVLVIGGSLGAQFLNERIPSMMTDWSLASQLTIWHQSGALQYTQVVEAYQRVGVSARVSAFIDTMAEAYAWADVVIARAGALTVSELQQVARPAILIPFPYAVDDHQYYNALCLVQAGVAQVLRQSSASMETLRHYLQSYVLHDPSTQDRYAQANQLGENNAAQQVAEIVMAMGQTQHQQGT